MEAKAEVVPYTIVLPKFVVSCQYRQGNPSLATFGEYTGKAYTFSSDEEVFVGQFVIVEDSKGFALVRVKEVKAIEPTDTVESLQHYIDLGYGNTVSNLRKIIPLSVFADMNEDIAKETRRKRMAKELKEQIAAKLEDKMIEQFKASNPDMAALMDEYIKVGGDYRALFPKANLALSNSVEM